MGNEENKNNELENIIDKENIENIPETNIGKKKITKFKIILLVLIVIIILAGASFVVYDKVLKENKAGTKSEGNETGEKKSEENENNNEIDEKESVNDLIYFRKCKTTKCSYSLKFSDKTVELTYEKIKKDSKIMHSLTLNNKIIVDKVNMACGSPITAGTLKENVIISFHKSCDIHGSTISAYNLNGNKLFDYQYLDDSIPSMQYTILNREEIGSESAFKIDGNKLIVSANRISHGPSIITGTLKERYKSSAYVCDKVQLQRDNITNETVVEGEYQITYEGNNKFSKPELIGEKTFKQLFQSYYCSQ